MKVTRENHAEFMFKAIPLLCLAFFIQAYLYLAYAPTELAKGVVAFIGVGLVGVFLFYSFYDHYHRVEFHEEHFKISITPLRIQSEYFYRDICYVDIIDQYASIHHLMIHFKSGKTIKLSHVDNADVLRSYIFKKKLSSNCSGVV